METTPVLKNFEELYPPAQTEIYRTVGETTLHLHFFPPCTASCGTAMLFFFGGGWQEGTPAQFYPHCTAAAAHGALGIAVEYRVKSRHGSTPFESVADAKAAIRWVRANAARLNIRPDRIVVAGGSAGGHLAVATACVLWEEEGAVTVESCVPNALVLFNPVLDTTENGIGADLIGPRCRDLSPLHQVRSGMPPALIFHGTNDTIVSFDSAERFQKTMQQAGNRCELVPYVGLGHGFFNLGKVPDVYAETFDRVVQFLKSLQLLDHTYAAALADSKAEPISRAFSNSRSSRVIAALRAGQSQTLVVYGTSLTAGGAWVGQIRAALDQQFPGLCRVENGGQGAMWSGWGVVNLQEQVLRHRPDVVLIEFAINDAYVPYACAVAQARANLGNLIRRILAVNSECEIMLQCMNPPIADHATRRSNWPDYYQMVRDVAQDWEVLLIDHMPAWKAILERGTAEFLALAPDGIHPSEAGSAAVTTPGILQALGLPII